jgi:hypothetical protein
MQRCRAAILFRQARLYFRKSLQSIRRLTVLKSRPANGIFLSPASLADYN